MGGGPVSSTRAELAGVFVALKPGHSVRILIATVTGSRTNSDGMLSKYSQFRTCFLNKKCFIH